MEQEIKNIKKAAERILEAVKNKERIILYGDADPDGVGSVIILKEALEELGQEPAAIYFPDREKEGYGLNEEALNFLSQFVPALFISLDCGIGNVKEVDLANKMGFEVVIIDHHEALNKLPKASVIVDPKQKGDKYPFKELACAGVVYKLVKCLFSQADKDFQPERFLELVLFATLSDQMLLIEENKKLVQEGILALNFTKRPGINALIKITDFKNQGVEEVRRKIISVLNAGGPIDHLNGTYLLLIEKDCQRAEKLIQILIQRAEEKKEEIKRIFQELEAILSSQESENGSRTVVFEGDPSWPLVLLGPVASRVCQKYQKPVFLYRLGRDESPGAVRMPSGSDGVKAMESCAKLLKTYGGHPPAAGFRIKNENLEKFKDCLIKFFSVR